MAGHTVERVLFQSGSDRCAGALYHPKGVTGPTPCVVMAHGFSGTMDWILPDFAERFADGGLTVFTFDYRHLGISEGEPRQLVDSRLQRDDLRRAVQFIRSDPRVDPHRIALWGTSLGGSHVVTLAAEDRGIAAVVANVPELDVLRGARGRSQPSGFHPTKAQVAAATMRLLAAAVWDAVRGMAGLSPYYIPVYGRLGRAVFSDPALAPLFANVEAHSPSWRNQVTPRFLFNAPRYRDGTIARIAAPLMITLARDDAVLSTAFVKRKAAEARHVEIKEYPVGHFDVYHGSVRDEIAADQLAFLHRQLARHVE